MRNDQYLRDSSLIPHTEPRVPEACETLPPRIPTDMTPLALFAHKVRSYDSAIILSPSFKTGGVLADEIA